MIAEAIERLRERGVIGSFEAAEFVADLFDMTSGRDGRLSVGDAARMMGISRRTFARRTQALGLPGPSALLRLARVLHGVHVLLEMQGTVRAAARESGWPDQYTFSNTLWRETGLRPTKASDLGVEDVVDAWCDHAGAGRSVAA